jgi:AcrR family transcriptional regulator
MQLNDPLFADVNPVAARRLLLAGIEAFASIGYHATTTRVIAARAGLSPAALYVHYKSKAELLREIIQLGHDSALQAFKRGFSESNDHAERIAAAVRDFAIWHARNQMLARVVQYELESLPRKDRREIGALRTRFETMLRNEIERGVAAKVFQVNDVPGTATAIFSLCIDVARWYSPRANRNAESIGDLYGQLALRMITPTVREPQHHVEALLPADLRIPGCPTLNTDNHTSTARTTQHRQPPAHD